LKTAPLSRAELPRDPKLTREIASAESRVHQFAEAALSAEDPGARAKSYANILATCADCHGLHRTVWGPAAR
jgi:cytochrome c553